MRRGALVLCRKNSFVTSTDSAAGMDPLESVESIASMQGSYLTPHHYREQVNFDLPYLHVFRDDMNRWRVQGYGHIGHDNEGRMAPMCWFLENMVLPHVAADAGGFYNIELHDSYTYLGRDYEMYDGVLTFSKHREHHSAVVVPDMYQMAAYGGMLAKDTVPWSTKRDSVIGAYTTTGDRNPFKNDRIQTCIWSVKHRPKCNLYITKIAQMSADDVRQVPGVDAVMASYIPFEEQLRHKYLLSLKGNTETWDQAKWLASGSLVLKKKHDDVCWYSPLMHDRTHVVLCGDNEDIIKAVDYYTHNGDEACHIVKNANKFVQDFLYPQHKAIVYWVRLLESAASNK